MIDPIYQTLVRIEVKQNEIVKDIEEIKKRLDELPCQVNTYKVNLLQKIVFGMIGLILLGFFGNLMKPGTEQVKNNTNTKQTQQAKK